MVKKMGKLRVTRPTAAVGAALVAVLAVWVIAAVVTGVKWTDAVSGLVAFGALCVALAAWRETRRSADADHRSASIAEAQEERLRYGWSVNLHPNGGHYELRNTGTVDAREVGLSGDFMRIGFRSSYEDGPMDIPAGEARAFHALTSFSTAGVEMTIEWLPDGETERRTRREMVPPMPSRIQEHV